MEKLGEIRNRITKTLKQVIGISWGVAEHVKKLPTKSKEVLIMSEWRRMFEIKRGEEIVNVTQKFNDSQYNSMLWKCKQAQKIQSWLVKLLSFDKALKFEDRGFCCRACMLSKGSLSSYIAKQLSMICQNSNANRMQRTWSCLSNFSNCGEASKINWKCKFSSS